VRRVAGRGGADGLAGHGGLSPPAHHLDLPGSEVRGLSPPPAHACSAPQPAEAGAERVAQHLAGGGGAAASWQAAGAQRGGPMGANALLRSPASHTRLAPPPQARGEARAPNRDRRRRPPPLYIGSLTASSSCNPLQGAFGAGGCAEQVCSDSPPPATQRTPKCECSLLHRRPHSFDQDTLRHALHNPKQFNPSQRSNS
jgi:hypothetical protein